MGQQLSNCVPSRLCDFILGSKQSLVTQYLGYEKSSKWPLKSERKDRWRWKVKTQGPEKVELSEWWLDLGWGRGSEQVPKALVHRQERSGWQWMGIKRREKAEASDWLEAEALGRMGLYTIEREEWQLILIADIYSYWTNVSKLWTNA